MIRVPGISSIFARQNRVNFLVCSVVAFTILCVAHADAQTVATYSFEDGTAEGWTSFNGASTPTATNAAAYAGSYSLLTTTGSGGRRRPFDQHGRRAAGWSEVYDHGLCALDQRRERFQCELHDQAERSKLLRRNMLRHDRHLPGPVQRLWMGADWRRYTVSTTETGLTFMRNWWARRPRSRSIWTTWSLRKPPRRRVERR